MLPTGLAKANMPHVPQSRIRCSRQKWLRRSTHNKRQNITVITVNLQCSCSHCTTKYQYLPLCWGAVRQKEMFHSCSVHGSVSSADRWSLCGPLSSTVSQSRSVFRRGYHCLVNLELSKVTLLPPPFYTANATELVQSLCLIRKAGMSVRALTGQADS